jgi:hypothetical protein
MSRRCIAASASKSTAFFRGLWLPSRKDACESRVIAHA